MPQMLGFHLLECLVDMKCLMNSVEITEDIITRIYISDYVKLGQNLVDNISATNPSNKL